MSILLDRSNRVLIQGVTGQMGQFFVEDARKYGTNMVAGVSPGRAGTTVGDVPVYASVRAAREATGADTAMVFVTAGRGPGRDRGSHRRWLQVSRGDGR